MSQNPASKERRTILVAAGIISREDGHILLTKRLQGAHLGGLWEFPGGKVEAHEDPRDALRRECEEECGIAIEVGKIVESVFFAYEEKTVLLLFYRCRWLQGEVTHKEIADHVWIPRSELSSYELPPADQPIVALLCAEA